MPSSHFDYDGGETPIWAGHSNQYRNSPYWSLPQCPKCSSRYSTESCPRCETSEAMPLSSSSSSSSNT
eukprot:g73356.t1